MASTSTSLRRPPDGTELDPVRTLQFMLPFKEDGLQPRAELFDQINCSTRSKELKEHSYVLHVSNRPSSPPGTYCLRAESHVRLQPCRITAVGRSKIGARAGGSGYTPRNA